MSDYDKYRPSKYKTNSKRKSNKPSPVEGDPPFDWGKPPQTLKPKPLGHFHSQPVYTSFNLASTSTGTGTLLYDMVWKDHNDSIDQWAAWDQVYEENV